MGNKTLFPAYAICDKDTEGAIPLYDEIGQDGKICLYAVKTEYGGEPFDTDRYAIVQSDRSGGGDGFGSEGKNRNTSTDWYYIIPEHLVFDTDGATVLGYAYSGKYDYYSNGDSKRYSREIFLPLGGPARCTNYQYSFTVYPQDGTSSSYSSSKYTWFVRQ